MGSVSDDDPSVLGQQKHQKHRRSSRLSRYDQDHSVPTINRYLENREREHEDNYDGALSEDELQEAKEEEVRRQEDEEEDDKDLVKKRMRPSREKKTDQVKKQKGIRTVKDPTTGFAVTIKDAHMKDYPRPSKLTSIQPPPSRADTHHSRPSPNPAHPTNISLLPYPCMSSPALDRVTQYLDWFSVFIPFSLGLLWILTSHTGGWPAWTFNTIVLSIMGASGWYAGQEAKQMVVKGRAGLNEFPSREKGESFITPLPESTEWLNRLVAACWKLLSSELLLPTVSEIEDTIMESIPFLDNCRFGDIDLGDVPLRIHSIRGLSDTPSDKAYPRDDWINLGNAQYPLAEAQSGDYTNLEVAFAYSGRQKQEGELRVKNIQFTIEFVTRFFKIFRIPIPIWIRLNRIVGKARFRMQFIPIFPYIRTVDICMIGAPDVDLAVSLTKSLPNILDLPICSALFNLGVNIGASTLAAPRSMNLNIKRMLNPAAIQEARALGVLVVTIHHGESLSAQDRNGLSDPYIIVAFAKFGKPLYSTRIILEELNPVFEETYFLLVNPDDVKAEESLSLCLWDSDKFKSDDLIGRVNLRLLDIMKSPNVMHAREDDLMGFEDANVMQGKLRWSVGYYERAQLLKSMERPDEHPPAPQRMTLVEKETMIPGEKAPFPAVTPPPVPARSTRTPPHPDYKSGVLSIMLNHINGVRRKETEASDTDLTPPSPYIEVYINGELTAKTRVRQFTTMPFYMDFSEHFVRDWKTSVVQFVVRDAAWYEQDPILGIVVLNLQDLFEKSSETTELFPMHDGEGSGSIHVSLHFSGFKMDLPANLSGLETGSVWLCSPIVLDIFPSHQGLVKDLKFLRLATHDTTEKLSKKEATVEGTRITWDIESIRLPVFNRFQTNLSFQFLESRSLGVGKKLNGISSLWLQELVDRETRQVRLPIIIGENIVQLRQNYLNEFCAKHHEYEIVGWLSTTVRFDPGLDRQHETQCKTQAQRHAYEVWDKLLRANSGEETSINSPSRKIARTDRQVHR
ncbi:Ca2-dependent lipid-binding protein CLB1/vesicle protein vp115/Granuphilin A, contains C2 domain [Phaffia rhodozyma]|uniref:Ca2-dependent lipid-binding protein CLB1/vesicle protein vp115/Granuphilin A, contains C2 domain n=1 Tax=Phaffia rhodozyma TaxID=264483 RepID=A0A0F7STP1_PHARH|nr:Ca2-dependent lipid-binding protein CLB1/vesicle protein vp115/Granuphilin A, contains C2 domain [Phaffia rhodozyma]